MTTITIRPDGATFHQTLAEAREQVEKEASAVLPAGAILKDGIAVIDRVTWEEPLKPRAICEGCGGERIFANIQGIAAQNIFDGGCRHCQGLFHVEGFLAPLDKLRRRVEDGLRKGPGWHIIECAKIAGVQLGN